MRPAYALALTLLWLPACSRDPAPAPAAASKPEPRPKVASPQGPDYYDAEGQLRESDQRVLGVAMPMGLTPAPPSREGLHVFHSQGIPLDKLIRYFGPRLFTGQIRRTGASIVYVRAVPMEKRDSPVAADVSIVPVGPGRVKVSLREYAPPPLKPPSIPELQKTLLREQKQIE